MTLSETFMMINIYVFYTSNYVDIKHFVFTKPSYR